MHYISTIESVSQSLEDIEVQMCGGPSLSAQESAALVQVHARIVAIQAGVPRITWVRGPNGIRYTARFGAITVGHVFHVHGDGWHAGVQVVDQDVFDAVLRVIGLSGIVKMEEVRDNPTEAMTELARVVLPIVDELCGS